MTCKPKLSKAQMEQIASDARANGYSATVTKNGSHVIAIKHPDWVKALMS